MAKIKVADIKGYKGKRKLTMLTAYDYPLAKLVDKAGIDMVLVGDSLANVVLGLNSTTEVGMVQMLHHAKAVTRAIEQALVIADMPFESYQKHPQDAVDNAKRFIDEAGCDAVKLEWFEQCLQVTEKIVEAGIAVMGHIGLTPQTVDKLGGFKVQGKDAESAKKLIQQALALEKVGCFSLVLECVPDKIAQIITERLSIPTIGIGAGPYTDGQVLVIHDCLGLFDRYRPKFVKQYVNLSAIILDALKQYKQDVEKSLFPDKEHSFTIKEEEIKKLLDSL
ncbi:MAG: 3-methyl-2-oxobutanoate hydroxymethyltransferase [Candidatus Omnitrophica bacterium]|nr:3-methyl-2-oxobutanoate hydroxymethyltransferase [Candidatus Omnitrophota bacterium]